MTALTVMPSSGVLVRENTAKQPVRLPEEQKKSTDESPRELTAGSRESRQNQQTSSGPALILSDVIALNQQRGPSPWQAKIPQSAIFYDEMARMEIGLDQPGLLVSVRI